MSDQDNRKSHLKRVLGRFKLSDPDRGLVDAFRTLTGGPDLPGGSASSPARSSKRSKRPK